MYVKEVSVVLAMQQDAVIVPAKAVQIQRAGNEPQGRLQDHDGQGREEGRGDREHKDEPGGRRRRCGHGGAKAGREGLPGAVAEVFNAHGRRGRYRRAVPAHGRFEGGDQDGQRGTGGAGTGEKPAPGKPAEKPAPDAPAEKAAVPSAPAGENTGAPDTRTQGKGSAS